MADKKRSFGSKLDRIALSGLVLYLLYYLGTSHVSNVAPATTSPTAPRTTAATGAAVPPDEADFIRVLDTAAADYAAANDFQKTQLRQDRAAHLCSQFTLGTVTDWTGVVKDVKPVGKNGDAYLVVALTDNVTLWTVADREIPKASALFSFASTLKIGDRIRFSGALQKDSTETDDCFDETSLTESGSMREPEFAFWFTGLAREDGHAAPNPDLVAKSDAEGECRKNLQCWGEKNIVAAKIACTPKIEEQAKYSARWQTGITAPMFDGLSWFAKDSPAIIYSGNKVQFQNGFGAWQTYSYRCVYDPKLKSAITAEITPGSMP